jgi:hypothetical protein
MPPTPVPATEPGGDLGLAIRLLAHLGDHLAEDGQLISRHGRALQNIDLVQQLLQALAGVREEGLGSAARLADLRRSPRRRSAARRFPAG